MSPKCPRVLQPSHLSVDDAWRVLQDSYSEEDLQDIRNAQAQGKGKLAFEYKHGQGKGGDKDALYKYRNVIKNFSKINSTGVWNWTVILGAVKKWDAKNLAKLLSTCKVYGSQGIDTAASNLAQLLQDARNAKRNVKTGSRTPGWLGEIIENIVVTAAKGEGEGGDASSPSGPKRKLTIGDSWSTSSRQSSNGLQRKRSLKLHLSTTSEEGVPKRSLLAIEDKKKDHHDEGGDDIEDTNCDPFEYDWDEVTNKGKRLKPGGRWQLCHRQEKDSASGFIKCIWSTPSGDEEWISEMTILEYESNEPDELKKKPAASMKRPAAAMKRPAAHDGDPKKMDPKIRKREHSNMYHKTVAQAIARGDTKEVAKAKGREAAGKHIQKLISKH